MAKTLRRSRKTYVKTVRDGNQYHCPEGDCDYCAAGRTYTRRRDALFASRAIALALR